MDAIGIIESLTISYPSSIPAEYGYKSGLPLYSIDLFNSVISSILNGGERRCIIA